MKRITLLISTFLICWVCKAPENKTLYILEAVGIKPYESIWEAICAVESNGDSMAYNLEWNGTESIGIVQIQKSRVDYFNDHTGKHYKHIDMYDPLKAKEVFMFYCSRYDYKDIERISRCWNGGDRNGMKCKQTYDYYLLVEVKLKNLNF
jgi:hypothetical protein